MLSARFGLKNKSILSLSDSQVDHLESVKTKINCNDYKLVSSTCICEDKEDKSKIISKVDRYGINLNTKFCLFVALFVLIHIWTVIVYLIFIKIIISIYIEDEVIEDYFKSQSITQELEALLGQKI